MNGQSQKCPICGATKTHTKCPNEITVVTKGCGKFPGLIVARISVMSGETVYSVAVTRYGGLWVKGDWASDTYWNPIGDKALEQDYPGTMAEILGKRPAIKAWQESLP